MTSRVATGTKGAHMDGAGDSSDPPRFRSRPPGQGDPGGAAESPTLPLPPPRDRIELDRLLHAVASTPSGERQLIIDTVAAFPEPGVVAQLLHEDLLDLPCRDLGRHLMLLAVIGQLRHASSVAVLERFVWLRDSQIAPRDSHHGGGGTDHRTSDTRSDSRFWLDGALQARAAEMLVWVDQGRRRDVVDRILREHPQGQVRLATVDALAYSLADDPAALESLRERVREEDRWAVGLPRRTADMDVEAFDAAVQRHQDRYGAGVQLPTRQDAHTDRDGNDDEDEGDGGVR